MTPVVCNRHGDNLFSFSPLRNKAKCPVPRVAPPGSCSCGSSSTERRRPSPSLCNRLVLRYGITRNCNGFHTIDEMNSPPNLSGKLAKSLAYYNFLAFFPSSYALSFPVARLAMTHASFSTLDKELGIGLGLPGLLG